MLHVFLSYHTPDREVARGLADRLAGHDPTLDVFFDRYDLRAGAFWIPALADAIGGADAVIVLLGARSPGPWQRLEYFEALEPQGQGTRASRSFPLVLPGAVAQAALPLSAASAASLPIRRRRMSSMRTDRRPCGARPSPVAIANPGGP